MVGVVWLKCSGHDGSIGFGPARWSLWQRNFPASNRIHHHSERFEDLLFGPGIVAPDKHLAGSGAKAFHLSIDFDDISQHNGASEIEFTKEFGDERCFGKLKCRCIKGHLISPLHVSTEQSTRVTQVLWPN